MFFELLQVALSTREVLSRNPSEEEWATLLDVSLKQAVGGITFLSIEKLINKGLKPPQTILYEWIAINERIRQQNELFNKEAANLTSLFESVGCHSVILKGQANARLYPERLSRQPGDIDIYVEGGQEYVLQKLRELGLINKIGEYVCDGEPIASYHHIDLPKTENDIPVEVHYRPSSGLYNPFNNRKLQGFLVEEARRESTLVDEGFYVPSLRFALVMQLAHILHHAIYEGVGLRQVVDYYFLLKDNTIERSEIMNILCQTGLEGFAGALMWVLRCCMRLEEKNMIAEPNEKRGSILMERIMCGGNFGRYNQKPNGIFTRNLYMIRFRLKDIALCPSEVLWCELRHIWFLLSSIPARFQRRKISLG